MYEYRGYNPKALGRRVTVLMIVLAMMAVGQTAVLAAPGQSGGHAGWSVTGGVGTTDVLKGDKGSRILTYDYRVPGATPAAGFTWTMSKTAESTGPLDVEWQIDGNHGFFLDWVEVVAFADGPDGRVTQTLVTTPRCESEAHPLSGSRCSAEDSENETEGPFAFEGRVSLETYAGHDFGFLITGGNFDSGPTLRGALQVKERD